MSLLHRTDGQETALVKAVRPKFERPPIVEQAISVHFEALPGFTIGDFGLFWALIKEEFPTTESQPLVEPRIETFEGFEAQRMQIKLVPMEELPRCFYRNGEGTEIVQVQRDRFTFNWTQAADRPYPHSEATVARFCELFALFRKFVAERELGELTVVQCEITNVNIIPVSEFGAAFSEAGRVFEGVPAGRTVDFLPVESYVLTSRHLILDDGQPIGRLHKTLGPVRRIADGEEAYRYELTARGAPIGSNDGIMKFFEVARTAINAAFLAATTKWAHDHWGIKHG